jgi:Derlin-2/3
VPPPPPQSLAAPRAARPRAHMVHGVAWGGAAWGRVRAGVRGSGATTCPCRAQVWRLATNFLFFGSLGLDFVLHMFFLYVSDALRASRGRGRGQRGVVRSVHYSGILERDSFYNRTPDYIVFMVFGATMLMVRLCTSVSKFHTAACPIPPPPYTHPPLDPSVSCLQCAAPFLNVLFYGSALTFMIVYLWSRRNRHMRMLVFGMIVVDAPYLPWTLLAISLVMGNPVLSDLLGIAVGHVYYYLADVYPAIAAARNWSLKEVLVTPSILYTLTGTPLPRSRLPQPPAAEGPGGAGAGGAAPAAAPVVINDGFVPFVQPRQRQENENDDVAGHVAAGPAPQERRREAEEQQMAEEVVEDDAPRPDDAAARDVVIATIPQRRPGANAWGVLPDDSDSEHD